MDEGLLNDLLECSVCLERLDTSSRVLPCQHTFCLKCLKVIVESHKELRCPECRILVETKVEELPPNVLLMRILEGMKNSAPRKLSGTQRSLRAVHALASQSGQQGREGKQLPAHARAMYDYISKESGDLSFKKGETILLQKKLDTYWYQGECSGRSGAFPITYVQVMVPLQIPTALCKALYDFRMSAPDEEGCLAFDKGAIITVHRRVDENWAEGRLEQRVGIFPIAFVELNQAARQLMNTTPLNRTVPTLPDHARAGHSEHRHHAQNSHRYQPMSTSMPTTGQGNYQNMSTMSQSHPNYQPILTQQPQILVPTVNQQVSVSHGVVTTAALPRNIVEPTQTKHSLDLIHFSNMSKGTMGLQSVSRITENYDRIRGVKLDYNSTPVQKVETTYQNVRTHEHFPVTTANFNTNVSSDSSSSMNTPSVGSTTTPNTSSNTSTCESAEPSLPSSPDNNTERNATVVTGNTTQNPDENQENNEDTSLNTSMGVLSLNESSTATNTSLNVSLPPAESPKLNASSNSTQNQEESNENASNSDVPRLDVPSSSKSRSSGPDSLLNFGLGLQAVLSPSHVKDGNYMVARHREHHRDKRHSLTPSSHLQGNHSNQNRHSAEILATSLLDNNTPERDRERRRRRERSAERTGSSGVAVTLPAAYVAVYPYKPQKPDELELKKGGVYSVHERCRDGWYKGWCGRTQRAGVFPGNYVAPAPPAQQHHHTRHAHKPTVSASTVKVASVATSTQGTAAPPPPDAPPRAPSPPGQPLSYPWSSSQSQPQTQSQQSTPRSEKSKEKTRVEKSSISTGVSLMKRLAAMKKCKSPPPVGYSMDNPVFDDGPGTSLMLNLASTHHPVHVRSGSCPSQLLRALPAPAPHAAAPAPATPASAHHDRRHKERHDHHLAHRSNNTSEGPWQTQHRKSASLDVTATATAARRDRDRDKHHSQNVKERFRCIVPYPPNSEYELELKVDDIVIVSKKRGDGWYKGTLQRTGRTGLFPASFVQSCPNE